MGEYAFAAQYQQRPSPIGGGIIKLEWFKRYTKLKHPMHAEYIVQAWDTAVSASESADYSACTTWYAIEGEMYLVDVFRKKVEFPALRDYVIDHAKKFGANIVLIETSGAGSALYKQVHEYWLHESNRSFRLIEDRPNQDKATRLMQVAHVVMSAKVHLPNEAEWLDDFLNELINFPNGRYDDQVDSFTMGLKWAEYRYLPLFR